MTPHMKLDETGLDAAYDAAIAQKLDFNALSSRAAKSKIIAVVTAYLSAAHAPQGGVRVKPLEWRGDVAPYYRLERDSKGMVGLLRLSSAGLWDPAGLFSRNSAAKAAAQADYESRILSTLTGSDTQ